MAWSTPTTRAAGYTVPHTEWNTNTVDNPIALRGGALAITSQATNSLIYASSASQLAALSVPARGALLYAGASGVPSWLAAGTAGYVLVAAGAGADPAWSAQTAITVLDRDVAAATVASSTSETTVYTTSVAGGTLSSNKMIRLTLIGSYTNVPAGNTTWRVKLGATTIATHVHSAVASVADVFRLVCEISAKNATNAQVAYCESQIGQSGNSDNGDGQSIAAASAFMRVGFHNSIAEDSTGSLTLLVSVQHSASAADLTFTATVVQVELI